MQKTFTSVRTLGTLLFGALAILAGAGARAEEGPVQAVQLAVGAGQAITLTRVSEDAEIRLDGKLDEPEWGSLPVYSDFLVLEPDKLTPGEHATRLRIFYTDRGLYLSYDMDQPPETIISRLSGRDAYPVARDAVSFTLDTSGAARYGFWFELALGDSKGDGTILPERQYSSDWDGPWRGATSLTATGWSAEFFIPWSAVSMPSSDVVRRMGLYASRKVAYKDERWGWPALPLTKPYFMSAMQPMEMSGVAPRQQYNIYPFTSVTWDEIDNEARYKVGTDVFWRPSSNFQLTATVNPDFGGVESDDVVVNLTATETFFPEKRLFFLEGQEIFKATPRADTRSRDIGNRGTPYTLINTRRIGGQPPEPVAPAGATISDRELVQPVELLGAVKTTGQLGGFRYGVLGAFEDGVKFDATTVDGPPVNIHEGGSNYGAARLFWENNAGGAYRAVGLLSTAVLNDLRDATAHSVDGHYYTEGSRLRVDGQLFYSDVSNSPEFAGDTLLDDGKSGYGGFLDFEYAIRQGVRQGVGIEYQDRHVNLNDFGFLDRNDRYRIRASHTRTKSNLSWARENQLDVRGFLQRNLDGDFTGGGVFLSNRALFKDLSSLMVRAAFQPKYYDDLNSLGNGVYQVESKSELNVRYDSDTSRTFSYGFGGGYFKEDLGGTSYSGEAGVTWRPNDRFSFDTGFVYKDRDGWLLYQQGRNFTTFQAKQWQPFLKTEYFISARQQLRLSVQWVGIKAEEDKFYLVPEDRGDLIATPKPPGFSDSFSLSQYSFQARYRWEIAPLSDLFIVYTRLADRGAALGDSDFGDVFTDSWDDPLSNLFIVKLRYRLGS